MKKHPFVIVAVAASLAGSLCAGAYGQGKPKIIKAKSAPAQKSTQKAAQKKTDTTDSAEPDKVLYDRAVTSMNHAKFTEARLDFQTLINTYPDSEFLAKAKLGIADSFYKEGGVSNLTQSVEEYKNFIVFFPFLDEASYAQMQVAMAHYRMMEKADRDTSQAEDAEDEFRAFLLKYPDSPLVPTAEQRLRNVQEVLADGEFRIAHFYYAKPDYSAALSRLLEVTARYPLYSQSDEALWMLGDIYQRAKQTSKNEDLKNHFADLAGQCYDRIVQDYPLSPLAPGAKDRLKTMGMPVPAAKPDAITRMQNQQLYEKTHHQMAVVKFPMEMIKSSPDVYTAARTGSPNLNPPDDTTSAAEVLNQGATGASFTVAATGVSTGGKAAVDTESVDTGTATDTSTPADTSAPASAPGAAAAIQMLDTPTTETFQNTAPAPSSTAPASAPPASAATDDAAAPNASPDPAPAASTVAASPAPQTETMASQAAQAASASSSQTGSPAAAAKSDPDTESSSKKKKGLQKLIPW